jgi:anti-sigma regulatory factor (Ser/Thr protein kinase)
MMPTVDTLSRSIDLSGVPESVGAARAFVRDMLGPDHSAIDTVVLLTSELVSNAIRFSRSGHREDGRLTVALTTADRVIHVYVIDEGSTDAIPEIPAQLDDLTEGGRGLWLVRELSTAWGWQPLNEGRVVWFEVKSR